ncbi:MAG: sigma-70 family RNA polymerase sigma factor [Polyangiaceae bacterium]|nr:sigma-70 family RNA polymerase sigma factor [Polyangiaceae bacterium]
MAKPQKPKNIDDLIAKAKAGDDAAKNELFKWARKFIQDKVTVRTQRTHVRPSDIVQDAAMNAARALKSFRGSTSEDFEKWLATIAFRSGAESIRDAEREKRDVRQQRYIEDISPEGLAGHQKSPSQAVAHEETRLQVARVILEDLRPEQRHAITLRLIKKLPVAIVARQLKTTVPSIDNLIRRTVKKIRQRCQTDAEPKAGTTTPVSRNARAAAFVEYMRRCDEGAEIDIDTFIAEVAPGDQDLRSLLEVTEQIRSFDLPNSDDEEDE